LSGTAGDGKLSWNDARAVARCALPAAQWRQIQDALGLTDRELQIVQSVFDGMQEPAIALRLGISAHTVHTHLGRVYRKLGVNGLPGMLLRVFAAYLDCPSLTPEQLRSTQTIGLNPHSNFPHGPSPNDMRSARAN